MVDARKISAARSALRFDAGSLALNLVATVARRGGTPVERLTDRHRLRSWCAGVGLGPADDFDDAESLVQLRDLREAIHDLMSASIGGRAARTESVTTVNEAARHHPPAPALEVGDGGRCEVTRPALTIQDALALIARDAITTLADDHRELRLQECAAEDCRMLYLPAAGSRARRWCSMSRCGNRAKAAAHHARHTTHEQQEAT
jgi:predicted RNA-binding Zn ribbon-like protein